MQTMTFDTAQTQVLDAQLAAARNNVTGSRLSEADKAATRDAAEQFEAVFISQMLAPMFETVPTDGVMGGGNSEGIFRNMMVQEVGKSIAKNGGIGIADQVYSELLKLQEG